ncbi:hypothetical protein Hdeb2414_s0166g00820221 [Helianthus debilis subsp. tardiflorus]
MAEPSNPLSTSAENPEPSSPVAAEEEVEVNAPGKNLRVLKWSRLSFETLMRDIQMPPEYGATYPQEGDTAGDAPAGYVTMFVDFFGDCNLRLPLTVFAAVGAADDAWQDEQESKVVTAGKRAVEAPLWRMFCPDFKGEVEIVACADGEKGFNRTIRNNFRLPDRATLEAKLPQGKGDLGALGDPAATGVPKQPVLKLSDKRQRKTKKPHETVIVPPLVPEVAGIPRTRLHKYDDYVVVSDTLEGLGVLGGATAAGGSTTGAEPVDMKKQKGDAPAAGGKKVPKLRKTRATVV